MLVKLAIPLIWRLCLFRRRVQFRDNLEKNDCRKAAIFDGDLSYREKEQDNSLNEYYSLSGSYIKDISSVGLPGKLRLTANLRPLM